MRELSSVASNDLAERLGPIRPVLRLLLCVVVVCMMASCGINEPSTPAMLQADPPPADPSNNVLPNYDAAVATLLDQVTEFPPDNAFGAVVWNTRYYMESLIAAYYATGNQKYIDSFVATGTEVFGLAQTQTFLDVPDPSAPGPTKMGPTVTTTGWPTFTSAFNNSVSIPTADGQISFYAQVLRFASGLSTLVVTQQAPGSFLLSWQTADGVTLATNTINSQSDLDALAGAPLDYFTSTYRIASADLGLPAPGTYSLGSPLSFIWHGEQTGGILIPYLRFLLLAQLRPSIADPALVQDWTAQVVGIADSYEDQLVSDGHGGLVITNPIWMTSTEAGLSAPSDYINAEITMRMLLYKLTGNSQELTLAKGLLTHEMTNLQTSSAGWLLLKEWPDINSWSSKTQAPYGSIYDTLTFDNQSPSAVGEGGFFVQMLQFAVDYNLLSDLGLTDTLYGTQSGTFEQFLRLPYNGSTALIQYAYPTSSSSPGNPIIPDPDPVDVLFYLAPVNSTSSFVCDNWKWMGAYGQTIEQIYGGGVGYPILDWAKSEAAAIQDQCPAQ